MRAVELAPVTWNESEDYESPVAPGDELVLITGRTLIRGVVARVDGFAPGVIELEGGYRVDLLAGWLVGIVPP